MSAATSMPKLDFDVHLRPSKNHKEISNSYAEEKPSSIPSQRRPSFHLTAPDGWLNDPCGPGYDPSTGLYHLAFQWNPYGNDWGNTSWGHAMSTDLVSWKKSRDPILAPSAQYDLEGVFTGCLRPTDVFGRPGALTVAYTSVSHLPIHYTLPYTTGSETLSLAVSHDGGSTWIRQECNPILTGPPQCLKVTGWRDPYLTTWINGPASKSPSTLYGFISGGIVDKTPTAFVYSVDPTDLRKWEFVGPLVDVGLNFRPSRWSGDCGLNWEVANLITLVDDNEASRDFVIMGAEGCIPAGSHRGVSSARSKRTSREQLWMCVKDSGEKRSGSTSDALTSYLFSGIFDHGCHYAGNSFWDPQTSKQIVYGWITEEDLPDSLRHRQGWSGLVSLPRVVGLLTLKHVTKARSTELHSITSIEAIPDLSAPGTFTIHTMSISPDSRLSKLRHKAQGSHLVGVSLSYQTTKATLPLMTSRWELDTEFSVSESCAGVEIEIAHSAGENALGLFLKLFK